MGPHDDEAGVFSHGRFEDAFEGLAGQHPQLHGVRRQAVRQDGLKRFIILLLLGGRSRIR